ncbi:uncharacterized protein LOC121404420 [Drosophila obscura]|uniref:uncharacterized protein LOC121404420 n=1 Tax=Drosophila obscura TaxID=7282 RepID=UPI001BB14B3B|nr:uncharacterized protein LOC121404420 [Drosophila obscura]
MHRITSKCKWSCIFIILMASIALYYDTALNGHGIFAESATGKVLTNAGLLPHLQKGCNVAVVASARGIKCYEKYVDPYVVILTQMIEDLLRQLMSDASNIFEWANGYFNGSWALQIEVMEQYAPNVSKKLKAFALDAMKSYNQTATIMEDNLNQVIIFAWQCNKKFHQKVDEYAQRQLF